MRQIFFTSLIIATILFQINSVDARAGALNTESDSTD